MKRFSVFLLVLPLILFTSGMAGALTLEAVDGDWSSPVGGTFITYNDGVSVPYGNGSQDQIRWGTGVPVPSDQSGLGFTGIVGPVVVDDFTVFPDTAFQVGRLQHFNNVISSGTAASAVDLSIDLDFLSGMGSFTFTFLIDETPNAGGPVDDIITFPVSIPDQTINLEGIDYTLELLGYTLLDEDIGIGNPLVSDFVSPEGGTNSSFLWAQLTEPLEAVPEPATLLLLGSGLLGLAGMGRKKFFKK